jgi:hypothetical protein
MKSKRECQYTRELDPETLMWTRGPNFPLSSLDGRLMCPRCKSRRVAVLFQPPTISVGVIIGRQHRASSCDEQVVATTARYRTNVRLNLGTVMLDSSDQANSIAKPKGSANDTGPVKFQTGGLGRRRGHLGGPADFILRVRTEI